MGKSRSKSSNSRSISKWRLFSPFKSAPPERSNTDSKQEKAEELSAVPKKNLSAEQVKSKSLSVGSKPKKREEKSGDETKNVEKGEKEEKRESGRKEPQQKSGEVQQKSSSSSSNKKQGDEEQEASVFEEVEGPAAPAQTGTKGIKNKMRWKIDVDPVDVNGDQKMPEVMEKLSNLRKKFKSKKCKLLKANEKVPEDEGEEPTEDVIISSARVLQRIKLESLVSKELSESDQEVLKAFCRSGDHEEKAEGFLEKISAACLNAIVTKNEFVRSVSIPGQLRMFAVDEKKAKVPMMALMMARKDLFYVSWSKPNREVEKDLDPVWANMAMKKVPVPAVVSTHL